MNRPIPALLVASLLVLVAGCAGTEQLARVDDAQSLVNYLESEGVSLFAEGQTSSPVLSQGGMAYTVAGGGTLQIFEYRSEASAALDAQQIDTARLDRPYPQFYRRGRLIAVYAGHDPLTEQSLRTVLSVELIN